MMKLYKEVVKRQGSKNGTWGNPTFGYLVEGEEKAKIKSEQSEK